VLHTSIAIASFLGASLVFVVQPMVGRMLLPQLGGAPFVWIVCLAFFQAMLCLAYLWVHLSARIFSLRIQLALQLALVALALWATPLSGFERVLAVGGERPSLSLTLFLLQAVGLAYFALATTTPLLQWVYGRLRGLRPYRLFAFSNAGSFAGLLLYPFGFERLWDLPGQARVWQWGFALYGAALLATVATAFRISRGAPASGLGVAANPAAAATPGARAAVFFLAAAPSALLSAISDQLTVDVAATAFLWVLGLAIYLLTYVLAFASERWHLPRFHRGLWIACSVALPVMLLPGNQVPLPLMLGVPALTLYSGAMLCHSALAERGPEPSALTGYYFLLSAGGAAGGAFVAFAAPALFDGRYELPLTMLAIHLLLALTSRRADPRQPPTGAQRLSWIGSGLATPLLLGTLYAQIVGLGQPGRVLERHRDFFGPLEVSQTARSRVLTHGRTHHGRQLRDPALAALPVAYFGSQSGAGRALRLHRQGRPRSIGVLGLGVGTVAAYAKADDRIAFFEINPEVTRLARRHFSYLETSAAVVRVEHGDGRLLLSSEPEAGFDLLLLDAFSSDSVPIHLLTVEAFGVYLRALAPDGILLANVSNRHLAVHRAVAGAARHHGLAMRIVESRGDRERGIMRARWALLARDGALLEPLLGADATAAHAIEAETPVVFRDRRASLLSLSD